MTNLHLLLTGGLVAAAAAFLLNHLPTLVGHASTNSSCLPLGSSTTWLDWPTAHTRMMQASLLMGLGLLVWTNCHPNLISAEAGVWPLYTLLLATIGTSLGGLLLLRQTRVGFNQRGIEGANLWGGKRRLLLWHQVVRLDWVPWALAIKLVDERNQTIYVYPLMKGYSQLHQFWQAQAPEYGWQTHLPKVDRPLLSM